MSEGEKVKAACNKNEAQLKFSSAKRCSINEKSDAANAKESYGGL